jgi:hypothetical protein
MRRVPYDYTQQYVLFNDYTALIRISNANDGIIWT